MAVVELHNVYLTHRRIKVLTPPLSIIIPSYNRQKSTNLAIRSVISQNIDCEIIVVDDCSDAPFELEETSGQHARIKLIRREKNGGAGAARNTGLEHARYDVVSFLDSDDLMLPGTLASRLREATAIGFGKNSTPIVHACGWVEMGARQRVRFPHASTKPLDFFSSCWFAPGSAILASTDWLREYGQSFDESLRRLEDFDFFARRAIEGLSLVCQSIKGVAIHRSGSANKDEIVTSAQLIEEKFKKLHQDEIIDLKMLTAARAYLAYEQSIAFGRSGMPSQAISNLITSFICKPRLSVFPGKKWAANSEI